MDCLRKLGPRLVQVRWYRAQLSAYDTVRLKSSDDQLYRAALRSRS